MKPQFFAAASLVVFISCQSPNTNAAIPIQTAIDNSTLQFKPLPIERWATATLPPLRSYPGMAHLARISGTLVMHAKIESNGRASDIKLISGPPQLAAYLDSYISNIQFYPSETDQPGPWSISVTGQFVLGGQIGIGPSGSKVELHRVSVGSVQFPR